MTTASTLPEIKTLEPDAAVALWLKGKDEWNKWVENNPKYNINFSNVDFKLHRPHINAPISFADFTFPDGEMDFYGADFGDGDVDFTKAKFGKGRISFCCAKFGNGDVMFNYVVFGDGGVSFDRAKFGDGQLNFSFTKFGDGDVNFQDADFGNGDLSFLRAEFGDGNVTYLETKFGDGNVYFDKVIFGIGDLSFIKAKFGEGKVSFHQAEFDKGNVNFVSAEFGKGTISFIEAQFGDGNVNFFRAKFGPGFVTFERANFGDGNVRYSEAEFGNGGVSFCGARFGEGEVNFIDAKFGYGDLLFNNMFCKGRFTMENISSEINSLSFRGATFTNTFSLSGLKVKSTIDLVNTKLTNQLSLHGLECRLKRTRNRFGVKKAIDPADAERANRVKELAEANKHHALALRFHADEMRAKRWQPGTGIFSSILDLVFDLLCNYGQSVFRPAMLWVFSIFAFVLPYAALAKECLTSVSQASKLLIFSLSNSLPFLTSAGAARTEGLDKLFDEDITYSAVFPLMMAQGVVTVILMFLIGLGLRNRFRL